MVFKHFAARAVCLIVLPAALYMLFFAIHLEVLHKRYVTKLAILRTLSTSAYCMKRNIDQDWPIVLFLSKKNILFVLGNVFMCGVIHYALYLSLQNAELLNCTVKTITALI